MRYSYDSRNEGWFAHCRRKDNQSKVSDINIRGLIKKVAVDSVGDMLSSSKCQSLGFRLEMKEVKLRKREKRDDEAGSIKYSWGILA